MRAMVPWAALLFLAPALVSAGPAWADEHEWLLVAEPTFGVYHGPVAGEQVTAPGGGGALAAWLGVTSAAWLFASAGAYVHSDDAPVVGEALGGLALALDVLRAIPFAEVGIGGTLVEGEPVPVLRVGLGLDYLVTSSFVVGAAARYRPAFGRGDEDWWTLSLRFGWRDEL